MKKSMCILGCLVMLVTTAFAAEAPKVGPWKKSNEKAGVIEYTRTNSLSDVEEYKAIGMVQAPVAVVESVLRDFGAWKNFMFMAKETKNVDLPGLKNLPDSKYLYFRQGLPWPVSDRDLVGKVDFFVDKKTGEVRIIGNKIDATLTSSKDVIHMPVGLLQWTLKPVEANSTEVTYQCLVSPGGKIPTSVLNMVIKQIGVETIINLRKTALKPQYQAGTIITQTPWQEGN